MTNEWTSNDVPSVSSLDLYNRRPELDICGKQFGAAVAFEAMVEHLNAHHPKPAPVSREDAAMADRLERQATSIARLQGELETAERDRDEAMDAESAARLSAKTAESDRARWRRAHGIVEQERITARQQLAEAVARAEAAEAHTATTVTREDVEQELRSAFQAWGHNHITAQERALSIRLGWLFAIEAGQSTDPVEEKARELARAGGIDFDEQEPMGVEMLIGMARHVIGQEAGDA
ncbi:hypothetical protein K3888_11265 [Dietzia aurantiaca]|uniref:hypothetical protein n=1 Tax=Dietzia aurantiaca TaxID=983873 RepID=UPI001E3C0A65|nr:hypothetical protein [Dietzia aurantiaca]MCD2263277.1 hypothetical protein [Dietzia aurantiaca]